MKFSLVLVYCMWQNVLGQKYDDTCECGIDGKNRRIVGGSSVQPHQYPWLVALMLGSKLHCGAAIITNKHILTAGHCITFGVSYWDLKAFIGMHDRLSNTHTVMKIVKGVKHPNFTSNAVRDINDIAVLTTEKTIKFNNKVAPICLPTEDMDFNNVLFTVAGWGKIQQTQASSSRYLMETKVKLVSSDKCIKSSIYRENLVPDSMMCAYSVGKDACQGDSGGPLFASPTRSPRSKYYQAGIVSWGIDCAKPDYPACGKPADSVFSTRIVGGRRAIPHSYPWAVLIFYKDNVNCGGALLTNQYILAAGHCFRWNNNLVVNHMTVALGLDDLRFMDAVVMRDIVNVVVHEQFTTTVQRDENDIAVVKMNAPVDFNDVIRPICLPYPNQDFTHRMTTIVGWGKADEGTLSSVLLQASLRVLSDEECKGSNLSEHIVQETMMCAFYKGRDGCQGDSGGPLLAFEPSGHYVLAGIVSWGIGCGDERFPGVYTKVSKYIDWINKHIPGTQTCK
ncbi:coagulation factor XI-like [Aricia agestis]|uniref:coagulation factor XI-like n=1 Tax=Aricia agestis TaxID=91739 RepID=UPI001C205A4E|nr:coagulation factor XI-like [Aricia agestis]